MTFNIDGNLQCLAGIRRRNLRAGGGCTPNTVAVVLIVVIGTWVHVGTIQVQVVAIVVTVRSRRPIVAVATSIVRRRRIEVAGVEEADYSKKIVTTSIRDRVEGSLTFTYRLGGRESPGFAWGRPDGQVEPMKDTWLVDKREMRSVAINTAFVVVA